MKAQIELVVLSVILLFTPTAAAVSAGKVIYVDTDATGANDGTSWTDAYNYLQDALASASSGDLIKVAEGVYTPDLGGGSTPGDPDATFQLKNGVRVKGGYAGFGEPSPNRRKPEVYLTILSGDLNRDDVDVTNPKDLLTEPTRAENSYSVVTGSGTNRTAVLDGFIITGGNANGPSGLWPYPSKRGGGVFNSSGSPKLINCVLQNNVAVECGGGMFNWSSSNPSLVNCKFISNAAHAVGSSIRNTEGGGMYNYKSHPQLTGCVFRSNRARRLGGGMYNTYSSPKLDNCTFVGNSALYYGGGIYNSSSSQPTLTNCGFYGNGGMRGGGVYNSGAGPTLIGCAFSGNRASYYGGGILNYYNSEPNLVNCTFVGNSARNGRALACYSSSGSSTVQIANCILWEGGDEIDNDNGSTITITYSDIYGGWPDIGNIDADPVFVDPNGADDIVGTEDDDLRLWAGSPCIDAGDNAAVPSTVGVDLDGDPRFVDDPGTVDTGAGTPPIVDMGAYEFQAVTTTNQPPIADAGDDQTVYAWIDGIAEVTLDGSDSTDPDCDELTYMWTWMIDSHTYHATGVNPTIELPIGEHTVELVVNDGTIDSEPDEVVITVVGPVEAYLWVFPYVIPRGDSGWPYILAMVRLSDISEDQVDITQPIRLYPGGGEAIYQHVYQHSGELVRTTVIAVFAKEDLTEAVPENGKADLEVVGQLDTGQHFFGSHSVFIIN